MPIQNKDTLAASVPTPPLGSTTLFTDAGLLKTKNDAGVVISLTAGGTVTSIGLTGTADIGVSGSPVTTSGAIAVSLTNTAVTPGAYTAANITVDAKGRITSAANGIGGGGSVTSVGITGNDGITVSGSPITTAGSITLDLGAITPTTVSTGDTTVGGNLLFSGTGRRILADFSDIVTTPNRALFQSSTLNGDTRVSAIPNGTSTRADISTFNNSDPTNSALAFMSVNNTRVYLGGSVNGIGTPLPTVIGAGPAVSGIEIGITGNVNIPNKLSLATASGLSALEFQNGSHITGPFSNPIGSRPHVITGTLNSPTLFTVVTNGTTAQTSGFVTFQDGNTANSAFVTYGINNTYVTITSGATGAAPVLPVRFNVGLINAMEITPLGNVIVGPQNILPPTATDGYVYLQTISGTPTGTPTAYTGAAAQVIDLGNDKFYFYSGSAWRNTNTPDYEEFVATAAQTVFNTTIPTKAKAGTKSFLQVFVSGIFQQEGATKQFTVTGATQITFNAGVALNSDVVIYGYA